MGSQSWTWLSTFHFISWHILHCLSIVSFLNITLWLDKKYCAICEWNELIWVKHPGPDSGANRWGQAGSWAGFCVSNLPSAAWFASDLIFLGWWAVSSLYCGCHVAEEEKSTFIKKTFHTGHHAGRILEDWLRVPGKQPCVFVKQTSARSREQSGLSIPWASLDGFWLPLQGIWAVIISKLILPPNQLKISEGGSRCWHISNLLGVSNRQQS